MGGMSTGEVVRGICRGFARAGDPALGPEVANSEKVTRGRKISLNRAPDNTMGVQFPRPFVVLGPTHNEPSPSQSKSFRL